MRISRIKRKMTRDFITNLSYLSINFIFFVYPLAVIHCHLVVGQSSIGFLTASTFIITLKWNNIMAKKKGWRGQGERRAPSQLVNRRIKFNWQTAMSGKTGSKDLCQATRSLLPVRQAAWEMCPCFKTECNIASCSEIKVEIKVCKNFHENGNANWRAKMEGDFFRSNFFDSSAFCLIIFLYFLDISFFFFINSGTFLYKCCLSRLLDNGFRHCFSSNFLFYFMFV